MSDFSFKKHEKIRKRHEFITIYKKGVKRESRHFKVALLSNSLKWSRLGLTVSKKTGNAAQRNLVKRRLREYFRHHKNQFPEPCDVVLTAKTGAPGLKYSEICSELSDLLFSSKTGPIRS